MSGEMISAFILKMRHAALPAFLACILSLGSMVFLVVGVTSVFILRGRPADTPENQFGHFFTFILVSLPIAIPWTLLKFSKRFHAFQVAAPENAVGGLALGVALVLWLVLAIAMGAEYEKAAGPIMVRIVAVLCLSGFSGAILAAGLLNRDLSVQMIFLSPFVAGLTYFALAGFLAVLGKTF